MRRIPFLAIAVLIGVSACNDNKSSQSGNNTSATSSAKTPPKKEDQYPPPPCHPGCFPAGTAITTPDCLRAIETIKPDEMVTLITSDGVAVRGPVLSVFRSSNRLVEVRTSTGTVRTTVLQPLCMVDGGFETAGNLKPGDMIWRWVDGRRQEARVEDVVQTELDRPVFNLVVGESAVFVAGGFLAKGKPPATDEVK